MNAIEFVKNYGIDEAMEKVQDCEFLNAEFFNWMGNDVCVSDLKQIVDAFDFVMEHGSVDRAKKYAESRYTAPEVKQFLLKAINLVERCQ